MTGLGCRSLLSKSEWVGVVGQNGRPSVGDFCGVESRDYSVAVMKGWSPAVHSRPHCCVFHFHFCLERVRVGLGLQEKVKGAMELSVI